MDWSNYCEQINLVTLHGFVYIAPSQKEPNWLIVSIVCISLWYVYL